MPELPPWQVIAGLAMPRILLAAAALWFLVPLSVFPGLRLEDGEDLIRRGLVGVFLALTLVHVLTSLQIYHTATLLGALFIMGELTWSLTLPPGAITRHLAAWRGTAAERLTRRRTAQEPPASPPLSPAAAAAAAAGNWLNIGVLLGVLAVTLWVFFTDAFTTPAPAMSDAPVTLAWSKYIEQNELFRGEVYPRGMYATLGLLRKLSGLNMVVVANLTGPLFGLLTVLSCVFFAFKVTRSWAAAAVAALLAGPLLRLLPVSAIRYVAHNAQEFGMIFVLPAAWYAYEYLARGRVGNRLAAAAAAGVTVFTHPLPAVFAALSMAAGGLAGLVGGGRPAWRRLPGLIAWVGAAALVGIVPVALALAQGQQLHASSVEYMQTTFTGDLPALNPVHVAAAGVGVLLAAGALVLACRRLPAATAAGDAETANAAATLWMHRAAAALIVVVGLVFFLSPYFGVPLRFFADRGGEFAALGLIVAAALLWGLLDTALGHRRLVAGLLTLGLVTGALIWHRPAPLRPDRHYTDQQVLQYLRAATALPTNSWTLITGYTGYALVLGSGYHQGPAQFLSMLDQLPADHTRWVEEGPKIGLGVTTDYILMVEKVIPHGAGQEVLVRAAARLEDGRRLQAWIDANRARLALEQLYDGDQTSVWHLTLPMSP